MDPRDVKLGRVIVLIIGLSIAVGCVSSSEGRRMRQELDALNARFAELNQSVSADRRQIGDLIQTAETEIGNLRSALDEAQAMLRRTNTEMGGRMEGYLNELQTLRGQLEQVEFRLNQLSEQLTLFMEDVDIRLGRRR
ncbi:MAG: hypothetical protein JW797_00450 [Bradymonadales bacterium]|nr:hypothetical protein [Bradymonadales bacterium]